MLVVLVAGLVIARPDRGPAPTPIPTGSGALLPAATSSGPPSAVASATVDPALTAQPSVATARPLVTPKPTVAARATGDPRLAYAEFLLRVNDDRTTVQSLNGALSTAAQAQDLPAVRKAAVAILDFAAVEYDWLREHPPAECYAAAHSAARAMLDAYSAAADKFIKWADAGGGLTGLAALGDALDAAQQASDALDAFGKALEATTCQA